MGKNRIKNNKPGKNDKPGKTDPPAATGDNPPKTGIQSLEPLALAQLQTMMQLRETHRAQEATILAKQDAVRARQALLVKEAAELDAELVALQKECAANDLRRVKFLIEQGVDVKKVSARLEGTQLVLTPKE